MGFALTSLFGTLLHFLYEWLGTPLWIAPFSGVNESTFEHMKLFFWPAALFALFESPFFRERRDFWCIKARGIFLGLFLIPFFFYMYNGVIGKSPDFINIAIFFISAGIAFFFEAKELRQDRGKDRCKPTLALTLILVMALLFVVFTFFPPKINLFLDPLTNKYGI